ncbi:MAG: DRTGG domain-containing protein [Acidobacteria bacterium]|nr:DRTGG domain-containing protein [Acidobacteriota bacterium]
MNQITAPVPSAPAPDSRPRPVTLGDVCAALDAEVLWCPDPAVPVTGVVAADLMSDVLVDSRPGFVLVTGLANVQTIRTAAIADLAGVVVARGKAVPADMVALAKDAKVPVFTSRRSLFEAAGRLYEVLSIGAPPSRSRP